MRVIWRRCCRCHCRYRCCCCYCYCCSCRCCYCYCCENAGLIHATTTTIPPAVTTRKWHLWQHASHGMPILQTMLHAATIHHHYTNFKVIIVAPDCLLHSFLVFSSPFFILHTWSPTMANIFAIDYLCCCRVCLCCQLIFVFAIQPTDTPLH